MAANNYSLYIEQGANFELSIQYKDSTGNTINLAGYTARSQVRSTYTAPTPLLDFTISIGEANGYINLSANAAQTSALPPTTNNALYVWDLELVAGEYVTRLLQGTVRVSPEVTR